ncbi:MAG: hypothetical protein EKK60_01720 [Gordonia sp. (in: high G+C Gram-positive bacteria)]|nr:MAG: hypothetical protein EKK60_01720 [Gordonia sp. (in: high G+C Gram-positive bacteria)]
MHWGSRHRRRDPFLPSDPFPWRLAWRVRRHDRRRWRRLDRNRPGLLQGDQLSVQAGVPAFPAGGAEGQEEELSTTLSEAGSENGAGFVAFRPRPGSPEPPALLGPSTPPDPAEWLAPTPPTEPISTPTEPTIPPTEPEPTPTEPRAPPSASSPARGFPQGAPSHRELPTGRGFGPGAAVAAVSTFDAWVPGGPDRSSRMTR